MRTSDARSRVRIVEVLGELGLAHRVQLRDAGVGPRARELAVADGVLRPIRRDWFAGERCDERLLRAVYAGVALSCVSAAAVHGAWDLEPKQLHVVAERNTPRIHQDVPTRFEFRAPLHVHWTRHPEPRLAPRVRAPIESLPGALLMITRCQPIDSAVAVVDSALGRGLVQFGELARIASANPQFERVLSLSDRADADSETIARVRLARRGVSMVPQVVIDGHPVDGLIGDRLVLQFDGYGPHTKPVQHNRDLRQDDRLRRKGYLVLRYSRDLVIREWSMIESTVLGLVRVGQHLRGVSG